MYRRKLKALGYHNPEGFNVQNEEEARNLVVWLEDQRIRLYKIEDREQLRDVKSSDWLKTLRKYLEDLECPVEFSQKQSVIDWLLAHAVRLEYSENVILSPILQTFSPLYMLLDNRNNIHKLSDHRLYKQRKSMEWIKTALSA